MLSLSMLLVQTSKCYGNLVACHEAITAIEENATKEDDKLPVYHYKIAILASEGRLLDAMSFGLKTLKKLGKPVPEFPSMLRLWLEMRKVNKIIQRLSDDEIVRPPRNVSLRDRTIVVLLDNLTGVAFLLNRSNFCALTVILVVEANLKVGIFTGYAFAMFGAALIAFGDTQVGIRCGDLALKSLEITPEETHCKTTSSTAIYVHHWNKPLQDTLSLQLQSYKGGVRTGDMYFAAVSACCYCEAFFFCGLPLKNLDRDAGSYIEILTQYRQHSVCAMLQQNHQAVQNLLGKNDVDPLDMTGRVVSASMLRDGSEMMKRYAKSYRLILAVFFNRISEIEEEELEARYAESLSVDGHYFSTFSRFYLALTFVRRARLARRKSQRCLKRANTLMKIMDKQIRKGNGNLQHVYSLCQAEMAVTMRRPSAQVKELFEKAIAMSTPSGFVNHSALCNEALGRHLFNRNEPDDANHYLRKAIASYEEWNATSLVNKLTKEFPSLACSSLDKLSPKSYLGRSRFQSVHQETQASVSKILQLDPNLESKPVC